MKDILLGWILAAVFAASHAADPGFAAPQGDPGILIPGERLDRVFKAECGTTEGSESAPDSSIYFSELTFSDSCKDPSGKYPEVGNIWRSDPATGKTMLVHSPSGQVNGINFDAQGNMLVAEMAVFGGRRIAITHAKNGRAYTMAGLYNGRSLMAPNDLSIDDRGRVYFTDSRYLGHEPVEQASPALYRIDPNGTVTRLATAVGTANGVAVSPDQKRLYVGSFVNGILDFHVVERESKSLAQPAYDSGKGLNRVWVFHLKEDGSVANRRVFVDLEYGGPDGMNVDAKGNLYVAVRNPADQAFRVYSPEGKLLAKIPVKESVSPPTNVNLGAWRRFERSVPDGRSKPLSTQDQRQGIPLAKQVIQDRSS